MTGPAPVRVSKGKSEGKINHFIGLSIRTYVVSSNDKQERGLEKEARLTDRQTGKSIQF